MRLFVQHSAGFGQLVAEALDDDLTGVRVPYRDDSSLLVDVEETDDERLSGTVYVKSIFEVIDSTPRGELAGSVGRLTKILRSTRPLRGPAPATHPLPDDGQRRR